MEIILYGVIAAIMGTVLFLTFKAIGRGMDARGELKRDGTLDKNKELAEALRIKGLPTFMIYKDGQMVWRQSGEFDANTLISLIQEQA